MSLNGTTWTPIGPSPIDQGGITANGQVTAIAVNPNNPNIIYIGTAWGGIWHTRNGGATWTPIFDRAPALGIGEPAGLAIDPIDTSITRGPVIVTGRSSRASQRSRQRGFLNRPTEASVGFVLVQVIRPALPATPTSFSIRSSTS
jgi:hypothetical protein